MIYFVEVNDVRNKCIYKLLKEKKELVEEWLFQVDKIEECTSIIFSPARKLTTAEADKLPNKVIVFAGEQGEDVKKILYKKEIQYINLLADEKFAIENAKLTAEGVLSLIITCNEKSIYKNKILIFGSGRVAKAVAMLLNKLALDFSLVTYNRVEYDIASLYCKKVYFKESFLRDLKRYDILINTIPYAILKDKNLKHINKEAKILEVASKSFLNKELLENYTFEYIPAPALPTKFCAESAGDIMLECIFSNLPKKCELK